MGKLKKKNSIKQNPYEGLNRIQDVKNNLVNASGDNFIRSFIPLPLNASSVLNKTITGGNRFDKNSFTPAQLKVLYETALAAQKRTGKNTGGTEYEDYQLVTDPSTYQHIRDLKNSKVNLITGTIYGATEPAYNIASTIGRYSYGYNPNNKEVSVSDIYNFTNEHTKKAGENYMKGRIDPYGVIRRGLYYQDKNQTNQEAEPFRTNFVINPSDTVSYINRPSTGLQSSDALNMGFQKYGGGIQKNEQGAWLNKYQSGGYSTTGYKADSPDRNNPYNIIPSGRITMQNVPHPVLGIDNFGNKQMMQPGGEYQFQGDEVFEVPAMKEGGIPQRYKTMGFTHVGQKKSGDGQHKWKVLAKKGDSYKVVQGGYRGMQDFKQHHSEERKDRFWDRMGGRDSSKAKDPFSPLYWHKRFGTWEYGGPVEMQDGGPRKDLPKNLIPATDPYQRSHYDHVTGKMYLTADQYNNPDVYNHESFHEFQDRAGRLSVPEMWEGPLRRPAMVASDELQGAYFNRQGLDANIIANRFFQKHPDFQFVSPEVMYKKYIDAEKYRQPWTVEGEAVDYENYMHNKEMKQGGMIKRADGSYSQRGLWDNIRANAGSGKKPTKEMLQQERKIRSAEKKQYGGWLNQYQEGGNWKADTTANIEMPVPKGVSVSGFPNPGSYEQPSLLDVARMTSAAGSLVPHPYINIPSRVVNSAIGIYDAYNEYQNNDKEKAAFDFVTSTLPWIKIPASTGLKGEKFFPKKVAKYNKFIKNVDHLGTTDDIGNTWLQKYK